MIYQALLYSRSLSRDYRWMVIPQKVSGESLKVLNQLYNMFDKHKDSFGNASVSPLYCLNHPEMTFLVSCGLSNYKDKDGRDIYCLQGIGVAQKYKRHLWLILPWILGHYDSVGLLNTWSKIDFYDADNIVRQSSEDYFFKLSQREELLTELAHAEKPPSASVELSTDKSARIPFNKNGLKELSHIIESSYGNCLDFAFGATTEMIKEFDFRIIASVGSRPGVNDDKEMETAAIAPSHVSDDRGNRIDELSDDLADRFNPIKKIDADYNKALGRSGTSRIFNQILPRFLSIFKIGKKLNLSRSSKQKR